MSQVRFAVVRTVYPVRARVIRSKLFRLPCSALCSTAMTACKIAYSLAEAVRSRASIQVVVQRLCCIMLLVHNQ